MLLGESISLDEIDAAEQMLTTFHKFIPELYGETGCTANAHLLSHLTKYVRLWGPLWTHSAFGFESKNGKLKNLFHSKHEIVDQLLFNVDMCYTLQQVKARLVNTESDRTLGYINNNFSVRSNMTLLEDHAYIVGKRFSANLTTEQSLTLQCNEGVEAFYRLFKDGFLYYSTRYGASGKRENTYCFYINKANGTLCFGQIELFTSLPKAVALVRQINVTGTSILQMGGNPCRTELDNIYRSADLLNYFMTPVFKPDTNCHLLPVDIKHIFSKAVVVSVSGNFYIVKQPNRFEHH